MTKPSSTSRARPDLMLDTLVVGGGIAGLWTLNLLQKAGREALLLEADTLGSAQTLASQGMVHGGLKYALGARLSGAAEAISAMPDRWRACLDGEGEMDLQGLAPLATRYYMFAGPSTMGRLTGFFASRSLRGRIEKLEPKKYPQAFTHPDFNGVVYGLNDFVLHTPSLLEHLAKQQPQRLYQHKLLAEHIKLHSDQVQVQLGDTLVAAKHIVLTAGAGSGPLLEALGLDKPQMQTRPLHQVIVRGRGLPRMYAHCLTGIKRAEPRLTITSHREPDGSWLWYLGGQLATDGVGIGDALQASNARKELTTCVPWLDWSTAKFSSLHIDRAEPKQQSGLRPDEAFVERHGRLLVAWPTKLSLVPDLGLQLLALLDPVAKDPANSTEVAAAQSQALNLPLPRATIGTEPWMVTGGA